MINVNIYKLADNLIIILPTAEGKVIPLICYMLCIFSDCAVLLCTALRYEILNDYNLYPLIHTDGTMDSKSLNWVSFTMLYTQPPSLIAGLQFEANNPPL